MLVVRLKVIYQHHAKTLDAKKMKGNGNAYGSTETESSQEKHH